MAKTIKQPKTVNNFDFSKISNVIDNLSKKSMIVVDNLKDEKSFINTGIYILNALISKSIKKGGVPKNRITIFSGPPQSGKSYIALNIVRNAQKENYNVFYIDTEFAIENSDFDIFGINIQNEDKFKLIRSNKVEDLKIAVVQILDALKEQKEKGEDVSKTLFILDSIGQLASKKEIEDAMEGKNKADMSRARQIKSLFRAITNDLGYLNIPLVCTNHIYMCLSNSTEILKSDGSFEQLQNINVGDSIKTLEGDKEILEKFEYEKCPILKLTLENGDIIKCTPNHKFLVKSNWNNNENNDCWKSAEELNENDTILSFIDEFKELKISKIELLEDVEKTIDIKIKDVHHYILKNGVISHNSMDLFPQEKQSGGEGINYAASVVIYLTIAKLEDKDKDDFSLGSTGVVVTAKARKNRLAKPKKVKFEIDHTKGCNPYKGLEFFCTPENFEKVGIAQVKPVVDKKTGEITYEKGAKGSKWYVKHLDKSLFDKQIYNGKVFNKDVIDALEPIVYEYFRYASFEEIQEINEQLDEQYQEFEEDNDFEIDSEMSDDVLLK